MDRLGDPHVVGFVSFSRAACDEAADRAADRFNLPRSELRDRGWFKTLHGICHRCLGVGKELLVDDAESNRWLEEALQDEAQASVTSQNASGDSEWELSGSEAGRALALWSTARNRLEGLRGVWDDASLCDDRTPDYDRCVEIINQYEQHKRLDGRLDFTDLLLRFSGWRAEVDGAERVSPQGDVPSLPCWIHDEMQDSSKLLDACFRRLIGTDECKWVYLGGDPFQAIYGWSGADHHCFLDYQTAKRRVMPKSWRCPAEILALGEEILRDCSDYWDRGIVAHKPGGEIEVCDMHSSWIGDVDPNQSWLILARTNFHCQRLGRLLNDRNLPWLPTSKTKGSFWKAPKRGLALNGLISLQRGGPIDGREWKAILEYIPSKADGEPLLEHGTKAKWVAETDDEALVERYPFTFIDDLADLGAKPSLLARIRNGGWRVLVEGGEQFASAVDQWGWEAVANPQVRIGTVHSAKGLEAENVAVLTSISRPVANTVQLLAGADEETRLKYVAVTRSSNRLIVLRERNTQFRWKLPI